MKTREISPHICSGDFKVVAMNPMEAMERIKSVKEAFGESPEGAAHQASFLAIFNSLAQQRHESYESILGLLDEHASMLPLFVRVEQRGQLLLHAALAHGAPLDVVRLLVEADDEKVTLWHPSRAHEFTIPLHLALIQKEAKPEIIEYLMLADMSRQSWTRRHEVRQSGRFPLHMAAARGGLAEICQRLIHDNSSICSIPDFTGRLALHYAAASGCTETIQVCLAPFLDAVWTKDDEHGALPLHCAGSVAAMEVLMAADVERHSWNARSSTNLTPLHRLIQLPFEGELSLELLQKLIDFDDTMLEETEQILGLAPLHLALQTPCVEMVRSLVSLSSFHAMVVRCSKWGNLPIHYAVTKGLEIARLIVEADPTLIDARNSNPGNTPLAALVSMPDASVETVKYLLERNPTVASIPDDLGYLPLHCALLAGGNQQVVQMLLEAYPSAVYSPQYQGALPIHISASQGSSLDVLEMLLAKDPSRKTLLTPTKDGCLPIHEAVKGSFVAQPEENNMVVGPPQAVIEFFIRGDPGRSSLVAKDSNQKTPLHYVAKFQGAAHQLGVANARAIVEANPETVLLGDREGNLPLHVAANVKHPIPEMLQVLVDADPSLTSLSTKNNDAHIPLALARERDTPESILRLLRVGSGPFFEDQDERTKQLWYSVKTLLCQQATTESQLGEAISKVDLRRLATYRDHFGMSLLHIAAGHSNIDILRIILTVSRPMLLVYENCHGELPLHLSAKSTEASPDALELLIESDETKKSLLTADFHGRLPLHNVMKYGTDPAKASCLLKYDFPKRSLYIADAAGNLPIHYHRGVWVRKSAAILVESDPLKGILQMANQVGDLPIHVHARNPELAMFLIQADGANKSTLLAANGVGDLPLHSMVSSFDMTPEAVQLYLSHAPAALGVAGEAAQLPLHRATRLAPLTVVQTVLQAAPEYISTQDSDGNTPLHIAAIREARSIVTDSSTQASFLELVLNQYPEGAKVANRFGQYPIHCVVDLAVTSSTLAALERLIQVGSPMTDTKGEHVIHYLARRATKSRSPERFLSKILERLLQIDSSILQMKNRYGLTAEQIIQEQTSDEPLRNLFLPISH